MEVFYMDLKEIGLRIKICRKENHLTQEKFAEMINVSPHYIYEIERGSKAMSLYTLHNIATCLNISTDYLLYGNMPFNSPNSSNPSSDTLFSLLSELPVEKRENLAHIITTLLPYLK